MKEPDHILFHLENCCVLHGCKNGDPECPVLKMKKTQKNVCEFCIECDIINLDDLESLIPAPS